MKSLSHKAKEEGKDFLKCLMIYHNSPHTGSMQSPMQILHGRNARSDLPMSNAAIKQLCIQPEIVRNTDKHPALPTHDLHIGQQVMYQDSTTSVGTQQLSKVYVLNQEVTRLLQEMVLFTEKNQSHPKPLTPQNKMSQSSKCVSSLMAQSNHIWPVKTESKKKS